MYPPSLAGSDTGVSFTRSEYHSSFLCGGPECGQASEREPTSLSIGVLEWIAAPALLCCSLAMHPILPSILLGLTAAAANIFGGAVIVQKNWDATTCVISSRWARDSCWPRRWSKWCPESLSLAGRKGALLVLGGYLLVHFFEHTITPHFHYGEETHSDEYLHSHRRVSVLSG